MDTTTNKAQTSPLSKSKFKIPYITLLLILSNVLVYYYYQLPALGGEKLSAFWLYKLGANVGGMTFTGDYWRLLTSLFMHGSDSHLLSNMLFLLVIGSVIELTHGRLTLLLVFLLGGLFSGVISAGYHYVEEIRYFTIVVSVGASGAIAALMGFLAQDFFIHRDRSDKRLTLSYCIALAIFLFYGKNVDNAAHIGGYLGGIILSIPFILHKSYKWRKWTSAVVGVLIIMGLVLFCFEQLNSFHKEADNSKRAKTLRYFEKDERKIEQKQRLQSDKQVVLDEWTRLKPTKIIHSLPAGIILPVDLVSRVIPTSRPNQYFILANKDIDDPDNDLAAIYLYDLSENKIIDTIVKVPFAPFNPADIYAKAYLKGSSEEEKQEELKRKEKEFKNIGIGCVHVNCFGVGIQDMVLSEDGKTGYAVALERGALSVIDIDNKKITASVKLGEAPKQVAINAENIYVLDPSIHSLFIVERRTLSIKQTLTWDDDFRLTYFASNTSPMVISDDGNEVYLIDDEYSYVLRAELDKGHIKTYQDDNNKMIYASNMGRLRQGKIWILRANGEEAYFPQTGENINFACQNKELETWADRDVLVGQSTLTELPDGTAIIIEFDAKGVGLSEAMNGYSLTTGQLIRRWPVSKTLNRLSLMNDGEHFLVRKFFDSPIMSFNESLELTDEERKKGSLGRYSCLMNQ